ncbi:MAG: mitochondrial fission ELM1 family protein [Asticcacaulis sp.]
MAPLEKQSLSIWGLSDGRAGIEAQVRGLGETLSWIAETEGFRASLSLKQLAFRKPFERLPTLLRLWPEPLLPNQSDALTPPWPDILIACGRASLALSLTMKLRSGGKTFVIQLQDPRWPTGLFDVVVAPTHDGLTGPNVVPMMGAPNRVNPDLLSAAVKAFADKLAPLPRPHIAVLIGGKSKAFDLPEDQAAVLADQITEAVKSSGGSLLLTFSRRTPAPARRVLLAALDGLPGWIWNEHGPNPYHAFLGTADHILLTEDSTNMATEAAATGKPVHILSLVGHSKKHSRLHADLSARGISRPLRLPLQTWSYTPLSETERVAQDVLERYSAWKARKG